MEGSFQEDISLPWIFAPRFAPPVVIVAEGGTNEGGEGGECGGAPSPLGAPRKTQQRAGQNRACPGGAAL